MREIISFFNNIFLHIINNLGNYTLLVGVILILSFIYLQFGFKLTILGIGIFFIIFSIIYELNAQKDNRRNIHR